MGAVTDAAIEVKLRNDIEIFTSAFTDVAKKYGTSALYCVYYAWWYRRGASMWPYYQVYGEFFKDVAKIPGDWEKWDCFNLEAVHGGMVFMTPKFAIISDRPRVLALDEKGRLHNESGPAVEWRDGMRQYYWHGVSVPDFWITQKHLLTPKEALTHQNLEQRRAACEILGWNNILNMLEYKVIDEDVNPAMGTLLEVEIPDMGTQKFLKVRCGTGREFALRVTRFPYNTAKECNAATYGWTPDQPIEHFIPVIRH